MRLNPGHHIGFQAFALIVSGAFLIAIAIGDARFFFDHPRVRSLSDSLGRIGARIVCGAFGASLVGIAYWLNLAFR